jgi:COP9 signalosome complex subunit 3
LLRLYKATPYHLFVKSYPHQPDKLHLLLEKEKNAFTSVPYISTRLHTHDVTHVGFLGTGQEYGTRRTLERAPRWAIKKLTVTYLTLTLHDIGKAVKIIDQDRIRSLILSMVHLPSWGLHSIS